MALAAAAPRGALILEDSKWLRLLTLLLFYFSQGFPVGMFMTAIPTWMAVNGASVTQTAAVVSATILPWTLKFVNGFLIDRYTYLPMGRRRSWIIAAQSVVVASFIGGAIVAPEHNEVFLISAFAFATNFGIAFQDVGIDSLAVDIMPEDERAKAAGIMFGAQGLGIATASGVGGILLENYGIVVGLLCASLVPLAVMIYGICINERAGEKRLPWSVGRSHPANLAIQAEAWKPLLFGAAKAIFAPLSLILLPVLFARSFVMGGFEAFHPVLFTQTAGWSLSEYTSLYSATYLAGGFFLLLLGGAIVDRIGSRNGIWVSAGGAAVLLAIMSASQSMWATDWFLVGFFIASETLLLLFMAAAIPIYMRLCTPAVAATQFTIYMAFSNFGRPTGAWIAGLTADAGHPEWFYVAGAGALCLTLAIVTFVRLPSGAEDGELVAEDLPQGEGLAPRVN